MTVLLYKNLCKGLAIKLEVAEKMYKRVLQGYEKAWRPDYISKLNTINNLGIYAKLGKLEGAEKMY